MRQKKYLFDLLIYGLVTVLIILFFKLISDRKIAALCAGSLFIFTPVWRGLLEFSENKFKNVLWWAGTAQFWFFMALPIFLFRIIYWSEAFENISVFGIYLQQLHQVSNISYMGMLLTTGISYWIARAEAKANK